MPLTVAGVQAEIAGRLAGKLAQAQLAVTPDPTTHLIAVLASPVRDGLYYLGLAPADPLAVTDADLARVPPGKVKVYLDSATLEALYVIRGALTNAFDQQVEAERQSLHQIATDLDAMILDYASRVPKLNLNRGMVGQANPHHIPNDPFRPPITFNPFPYHQVTRIVPPLW